MKPFIWQKDQWKKVGWSLQNGRLTHALLLTGISGLGKAVFAQALIEKILCSNPTNTSCGQCQSCHLLSINSHPDVLIISPEDGKKTIGIDAVRKVRDFISLKSHMGNKVVFIKDVENFSTGAANALLKTLEEPTANTFLILTTSKSSALPATIRSRCQMLLFPSTYAHETVEWLEQQIDSDINPHSLLEITNGAPLAVIDLVSSNNYLHINTFLQDLSELLQLKSNAINTAEKWFKKDILIFEWYYQIVAQLIKQATNPELVNKTDPLQVKSLFIISKLGLNGLLSFNQHLVKALRLIKGQSNKQMLLESLFLIWQQHTSYSQR